MKVHEVIRLLEQDGWHLAGHRQGEDGVEFRVRVTPAVLAASRSGPRRQALAALTCTYDWLCLSAGSRTDKEVWTPPPTDPDTPRSVTGRDDLGLGCSLSGSMLLCLV
jgi:hypothetical protein